MAREGLLPAALGRVHPVRHTPWVSVLLAFALAAGLALSGGVEVLAQTTSLLLLCVFTTLHLGLLRVKNARLAAGDRVFITPAWTPAVGLVLCGGLATQFPPAAYLRLAIVVVVGLLLYAM